MESLLLYFVKDNKDSTILPKKYPDNCTIGGLNWQPIIMIIYNKSLFSTNNSCWKIWTLEKYKILYPKRIGRNIIISNFLFL